MSSLGTDLRHYMWIFLTGLLIEYVLLKNNIVPDETMSRIAPAWSSTYVYISTYRILAWIFTKQQKES